MNTGKKGPAFKVLLLLLPVIMIPVIAMSQLQTVIVNMAQLEGAEVNPENLFNYQVVNNGNRPVQAEIKGTLRYRGSSLRFQYTFNTLLQPGTNNYSKGSVNNPVWNFSDNAFRELFFNYGKLPQGTYEYCVELGLQQQNAENQLTEPVDACVYYTVKDIFLINLIEPEDEAELYEPYPMLSWIVNYPFASALTYNIRVAERKEGQNKENAITRNNPVYKNNQVFGTSIVYPITAKPLKKFQPYVWTVDAYYKGILLGGAEVWQFTIIEDSLLVPVPPGGSYVDLRREKGKVRLYAAGVLKLKYVLHEKPVDSLSLVITDKNGKEIKLKEPKKIIRFGDNRFEINLQNDNNLTHRAHYTLKVHPINGKDEYTIPFIYLNPDFIKE